MRNFILLGILLWVCVGCVSAQSSEIDDLCAMVNEKVVIPQKPLKVKKENVATACVFKLTFENDRNIGFRVEQHQSVEEASFELETLRLHRIRQDINDDPLKSKYENNVDPTGFWDEAVFSDNSYLENFILIRRNKYFILILGSDLSAIKRIEHLLRNVPNLRK